ncbi:Cyclophilin-like domain-containing protein [Bordetella tumbae]|uniref:cyclophilin-like fold protein n=1 Tax=Bordetella tumbae TaxID=1649139 RepID=UPI0039EF1265
MIASLRPVARSQRYLAMGNCGVRGRLALYGLGLLCGLTVSGACNAAQPEAASSRTADTAAVAVQQKESRMWMTVDEHRFAITLADTEAARAFAMMLPLSIDMADLNNNEKHADLKQALPTNSKRPGTIRNGDLMLYGSRTLVVFYLTFNTPYSYTRLGRVDDPAGLAQALGGGSVRIEFSKN